ncbi:MAG: TIGR00266 family protein [Caldisericota bacterium]|nr:TIGR00266 family protein [Caldisericota bacterium]
MQHRILYPASYALLELQLGAGEAVTAEADAMVSMSMNMQMETGAKGGLFGALKRAVGGESMFQNTFTAQGGPGVLMLAPTMVGDITAREMRGESLFVQSGSYLASSTTIELDTKWGGARTFFSGEGLVVLKATGMGMLYLSSYGAIHPVTLGPGEKLVMDTGHMVAFDATMDYRVRTIGGLKQTLFSGEGLVVELTGPGTMYMQTRNFPAFVNYLVPKLPFKRT